MSHSTIIHQPSLEQIIEAAVRKGSLENLSQGHKGATLLLRAVRSNNTKIVRILLQQGGVNPNFGRQRPGKEHYHQWRDNPRHTDRAIDHGNVEMLQELLVRKCHVGDCNTNFGTSLNNVLLYGYKSREIKLAICRLLVEHAKKNEIYINSTDENSTDIFLQTTLWWAIVLNGKQGVEILLEAGVEPRGTALLYRAIRTNNLDNCQVLLQYGANPFLQEPEVQSSNAKDVNVQRRTITTPTTLTPAAPPCTSPFHASARLSDRSFLELFLKHWDCTSSKTDQDECYYPIQIIYRDSQQHVSLEAVNLIVAHACKADVLMKKDATTGLYPLHSAAMSNSASLDVIFLLLRHWPSALLVQQQQPLTTPPSSPFARMDLD